MLGDIEELYYASEEFLEKANRGVAYTPGSYPVYVGFNGSGWSISLYNYTLQADGLFPPLFCSTFPSAVYQFKTRLLASAWLRWKRWDDLESMEGWDEPPEPYTCIMSRWFDGDAANRRWMASSAVEDGYLWGVPEDSDIAYYLPLTTVKDPYTLTVDLPSDITPTEYEPSSKKTAKKLGTGYITKEDLSKSIQNSVIPSWVASYRPKKRGKVSPEDEDWGYFHPEI